MGFDLGHRGSFRVEPLETVRPGSTSPSRRGECFLAHVALSGRGPDDPVRVRRHELTALMERRSGLPSTTDAPFTRRLLRSSCHPQNGRRWGRPPHRRLAGPFRSAYRSGLPRRDDVGLSPVSVVHHFAQAKPPLTSADRCDQPCRVAAEESTAIPECFMRLGTLAPRRSRNVTPPELSRPGPSVSKSRWLHTLPEGKFESRVPYGHGPARVGLDRSVWDRSHRLRLSRPHLRLTPNPTRKRGGAKGICSNPSLARRVSMVDCK